MAMQICEQGTKQIMGWIMVDGSGALTVRMGGDPVRHPDVIISSSSPDHELAT
jgi:hypothetical protein